LPEKYVLKIFKSPNFTRFWPEKLAKYPHFYDFCLKINKISEFYMIFLPEKCRHIIIAPKNIFS